MTHSPSRLRAKLSSQGLGESTASVSGDVFDAAGKFAVAFAGVSAQWYRGYTINAHERLALQHLWESGPMTMSDLGSRIPLSRAAVTALTDRLEALGYVKRTPDEHDRRRTVLSLTGIAQEHTLPLVDGYRTDFERLLSTRSPAERAAIEAFLIDSRALAHGHAAKLRLRRDDEINGTI